MRKILIVEDEAMIREAYRIMLSSEPYELCLASHGREALEKCLQTTFDLILLDLMMPVMNGIEFLREFNKLNAQSKIIVLSNLSSGKETADALALGAHRSVIKANLAPKQLLTLVRYEVEA